jgi:hypothetical protein
MLAALGQNTAHMGVTAAFVKQTGQYSLHPCGPVANSPLESFHVSKLFELLKSPYSCVTAALQYKELYLLDTIVRVPPGTVSRPEEVGCVRGWL